MEKVDTTERLSHLRDLMKKHKVDIYIVPSEDAHSSEYIAPTDARRQFISGFTGSAGTAVITHDKAALATDGRYFNQAGQQLDENWTLLKQGLTDVPTWQEWTVDEAGKDEAGAEGKGGKTVGVDPTTITSGEGKKLGEKIKKKGGKGLVPVPANLVDEVWGGKKPGRPNEPVKVLDVKYAGKSYQEKIEELRKELEKKKAAGFVVSMLDEVAWLFNLRGNDIPYNPVFFSYAVVTATDVTLYIDEHKLESGAKEYLENVTIKPYEAIFTDLAVLANESDPTAPSDQQPVTNGTNGAHATTDTDHTPPSPKRKYLISTKASWALSEALGGSEKVDEIRSLIGDAKAIKNDTELEGMRQCHIRDGAALSEFFAWLEFQLSDNVELDECQAADKLEELRKKHGGEYFRGLSFPTISSSGANAAVIHYKPQPDACSRVEREKIYLCDSGAQYLDGTTDTTRTLHFGEPTAKERETYTLVLKGHIALDVAVFPKGTSGFALDTLARQFLWSSGLEYRHGTGHGIGSFLNVHEGPIGIGTRIQYSEVPLSAGNVISNEPGYYEDENFGIRIENVVMVRQVETKYKFPNEKEAKPSLGFEHVTMVPMCRNLIDTSMLSERERSWLNEYHKEVLAKTRGFFEGGSEEEKRTLRWLERECGQY